MCLHFWNPLTTGAVVELRSLEGRSLDDTNLMLEFPNRIVDSCILELIAIYIIISTAIYKCFCYLLCSERVLEMG